MAKKFRGLVFGLAALVAVVAGCGDDDTSSTTDSGSASSDDATAPDESAGSGGSGNATLVVGDDTYEFDNFLCAFGYASTESEIFSFSSNSNGVVDGVQVQMQLTVEDSSGADQLTGDAVDQRIDMDDIENFENPSVTVVTDQLTATFDGDKITAEGTFWDEVADPTRTAAIPGTLEATCGAGSRR